MKKKRISMNVINPNAAGIDIGSRSYFVAIGQGDKDVREFGVYAEDLMAIVQWLLESKITTVAMESTGTYWQNLLVELINAGLEVILTNDKFTKKINRKKTDVLDCQWIQKRYCLGLLPSGFLPDHTTERLRTYCRHSTNMMDQRADCAHKLQKFLKYLNFRLDVVVRDSGGLTAMKIIDAICNGNLDPQSLAEHRHHNCRKSEEEIAKALVSNKREDYLFGLKQEFARDQFYTSIIGECDKEITQFLEKTISEKEVVVDDLPEPKPHKRQNKNDIKGINLNIVSCQYFGGVDLLAIPGV
ncbi:MAG: transposase, partial [Bacteroidota bacterium]